jgi:hypothetical protein
MTEEITYLLNLSLGGPEKLKVFYNVPSDYSDLYFDVEAELDNIAPSSNSGNNRGLIRTLITGADPVKYGAWVNGGSGDLNQSNIQVTGSLPLNLKDSSCIFEFSLKNKKRDILFGSFEKEAVVVNDQEITGVKGFNFGINDRGHMFFNSADSNGEYILVADKIELSDKNIISFSLGSNKLDFARFDYFNQKVESQSFDLDTNSIQNSTGIFIGGSLNFLGSSNTGLSQKHQDSFYLNSLMLFSGYMTPKSLFNIGSGLVSTYSLNTGGENNLTRVTGYSDVITYKTGVTGYSVTVTGSRNLPSGAGLPTHTGSYVSGSISAKKEGERYFSYYDIGSGFYKEEIGMLSPQNFGQYDPTGQIAFSTLGLQDVSENIVLYNESAGSFVEEGSIPLYGLSILTGVTDEISGVLRTALTEEVASNEAPSSGLSINVSSLNGHKNNFLYLLDQRI